MAPRPPRPVFLAPAGYRQKRVRDAARLLPALGAGLLLLPMLWSPSDRPDGVGNAVALVYVFAVWAGLILAAFILSRALRPDDPEEEPGDKDESPWS
jgi:hypothetical protein